MRTTYSLGQFVQAVSQYHSDQTGRWPTDRSVLRWRRALGIVPDKQRRFWEADLNLMKKLIDELKAYASTGMKPRLKTISERILDAYFKNEFTE